MGIWKFDNPTLLQPPLSTPKLIVSSSYASKGQHDLKHYLLSNDNKAECSFLIFPSYTNVDTYFSPLYILARNCLNICHAVVTFSKQALNVIVLCLQTCSSVNCTCPQPIWGKCFEWQKFLYWKKPNDCVYIFMCLYIMSQMHAYAILHHFLCWKIIYIT